MKICLVGPSHPYRGGISHFTQMLAREFQREHEVLVVGFTRLYPSFLFPGRTQFDEGEAPIAVESLRLIDSIDPFSWRRAARAVEQFGADLIVFQWWQPFFAPAFRFMARRARRGGRTRVVYLCHNVLPHEARPLDRPVTAWGLAEADGYVVQSRADGAVLESLRPGRSIVFNPMPVFDLFGTRTMDRADARRAVGVDGNVLLFFGLVRAYKGLPVLLDAFARCADRLDATLLVVGEFYEERNAYDRLIRSLGIADRVRVVDRYVPNHEVPAYFAAADVVVLPYVSATQSAVVQTAFSFAVPVIVTAVGGLPDVVANERTGFVVPPQSPAELASAIARFFDERWGGRMRAAIEADRGAFSWSACTAACLRAAGLP